MNSEKISGIIVDAGQPASFIPKVWHNKIESMKYKVLIEKSIFFIIKCCNFVKKW